MQEELDKQKAEQLKAEESQRKEIGLTTALHDWRLARDILRVRLPFNSSCHMLTMVIQRLKVKPMPTVKGSKEYKARWNAGRREIIPKIGQLTNDADTVSRVVRI